jgi:hypothetical protein
LEGVHSMVIEASVVAGYVVAWAVRKARRVGGRLDGEADTVLDAGLDRLHKAVAAKLGADPALRAAEEEAAQPAGTITDLTRQRIESAIAAEAAEDDTFGRLVTNLVAEVQATEQRTGTLVQTGGQATLFTGDAHAEAGPGGIAIGQVGRDVHFGHGGTPPGPPSPGR